MFVPSAFRRWNRVCLRPRVTLSRCLHLAVLTQPMVGITMRPHLVKSTAWLSQLFFSSILAFVLFHPSTSCMHRPRKANSRSLVALFLKLDHSGLHDVRLINPHCVALISVRCKRSLWKLPCVYASKCICREMHS